MVRGTLSLWRLAVAAMVVSMGASSTAIAQDSGRTYVGGFVGVATLSADGRSVVGPMSAMVSQYKPENGLALHAFAGVHAAQYFTLQATYMWNRNDLTLVSAFATPDGGGFYQQRRQSSQQAIVADGLVYFRRLDSRIRPYLGTGLSVVRFRGAVASSESNRLTAPSGVIAATRLALRSHVGIDVAISPSVVFRYSFSETLGANPISPHLSPPGERGLANFQNLFGVLWRLQPL